MPSEVVPIFLILCVFGVGANLLCMILAGIIRRFREIGGKGEKSR